MAVTEGGGDWTTGVKSSDFSNSYEFATHRWWHGTWACDRGIPGYRGALLGAVEIYQSGLLCPPGPGTSVSSPKALVLAGLA